MNKKQLNYLRKLNKKNGRIFKNFYTMIQNDTCIRQQLLHYFDQTIDRKTVPIVVPNVSWTLLMFYEREQMKRIAKKIKLEK